MTVPTNFEEWFAVSDHVEHDSNLEAVRLNGDRLVLGWRAGPGEPEFNNLAHEMSHMIEIPHNRVWWGSSWGMHFRETFVYDRMCTNPLSDTGTRREIRTIAIQWLLLDHFAVETPQETARHVLGTIQALRWVYDHCLYTFKRPSLNRIPYQFREESATRRAVRDVMRCRRKLNLETLWRQWCEKCEVLEHVLT